MMTLLIAFYSGDTDTIGPIALFAKQINQPHPVSSDNRQSLRRSSSRWFLKQIISR